MGGGVGLGRGQPITEMMRAMTRTAVRTSNIHCSAGDWIQRRMRRPKRRARTPRVVKRTMRAAPTIAAILQRGYWRPAAAMMKGVKGNGGGAMDASTSAQAAFF